MYSEFSLIEFIKNSQPTLPEHIEGIGDDCAIIKNEIREQSTVEQVITCDTMVENVHFIRKAIKPYELGRKAAATNLSDIAAMGAKPEAMILALAIPSGLSNEYLEELINGVNSWGIPLIGGDTTKAPEHLVITITAIGKAQSKHIKRRADAEVGDTIYLSGIIGDSAAGLHATLNNTNGPTTLISAHNNPTPHLEIAAELATQKQVHAMMDVSDGLASDLLHILKASNVAADVETDKLPLSEMFTLYCSQQNLDPTELAATGGEDYVLLFTANEQPICKQKIYPIGKIKEGSPHINWIGNDITKKGFTHF